MNKEDFFTKSRKQAQKWKKIPKFKEKNRWRPIKIVGTQEKGVGTQENAVGASEKCQILCKNLQKLSKNEKFHKILQENYIFCAKTALSHDVFCTGAPTAYLSLTVFFARANGVWAPLLLWNLCKIEKKVREK